MRLCSAEWVIAVGQFGLANAAVIAAALIVATVPSHRCPECGERLKADVLPMLEAPEPEPATARPPTDADLTGELCLRCGSDEVHVVEHRRLKGAMLRRTFGVRRPAAMVLPAETAVRHLRSDGLMAA